MNRHVSSSLGPRASTPCLLETVLESARILARAKLILFGTPRLEVPTGREVVLPTRRALLLLAHLATRPGQRASRRDLAAILWPDEPFDTTGPRLRQELSRLRRALDPEAHLIWADARNIGLAPHLWEVELAPEADTPLAGPFLAGFDAPWITEVRRSLATSRSPHATAKPERPTVTVLGRRTELEKLAQWLHPASGVRLVTVMGPGGIGKSYLLQAAARHLRPDYDGRVYEVDLSEEVDLRQVPSRILSALDQAYVPTAEPERQVLHAVPPLPTLLILDNTEQFGDWIQRLLTSLLYHRPHLRILVGSRVATHLASECRLPLSALALPPREANEDELARHETVSLFREMAEAAGATLAEPTDLPAIAAVIRRLEGVPLGLRLAAPYLRTHSASELLARFDCEAQWLCSKAPDTPDRHRTVERALEGSFERLPSDLRRLMSILAIFRGSWSTAAVAEVAQLTEPHAALEALLDASLIERVLKSGPLRYRMLGSIREYALRLLPSDERRHAERRFAEYYANLVESLPLTPVQRSTLRIFETLEPDRENLFTATEWSIAHQPALAVRLVGNLAGFWIYRTDGSLALRLCKELFADPARLPVNPDRLWATHTYAWLSYLLEHPGAPQIFTEGVRLGQELGHRKLESSFLALHGLYAQNTCDYALCENLLHRIDAVNHEMGPSTGEGTVLRLRGLYSLYQGSTSESLEHYREAVEWSRRGQDIFSLCTARLHLVNAAVQAEDPDLADLSLQGLVAEMTEIRFDALLPTAHLMTGNVAVFRKQWETAEHHLNRAHALFTARNVPFHVAYVDHYKGQIGLHRADYDAAGHHYRLAADRWATNGHATAAAIALLGVAVAYLRLGKPERAHRIYQSALRALGDPLPRMVGHDQVNFQEVTRAFADAPEEARLRLREAIDLAQLDFPNAAPGE